MRRTARDRHARRTFSVCSVCAAAMLISLFGAQRVSAGDPFAVPKTLGPQSRQEVAYSEAASAGTIVVDTQARVLYLVTRKGTALKYDIGVGREGFGWSGTTRVGAKREWPDWRPPSDMRARNPSLPEFVPAGPHNPLGARAIYLYQGGRDTLYRIHGTNDNGAVGQAVTSGCFRLSNRDVIDLYERVNVGATVIVR
ncbi:L,D-transpeptidase [Hongsoonwoonella zoysiae]|uniref:L,D-transpeptidase n=1 Tax=Hongsoonwoonella zoysiae TaxID=2821844 RepID=UPI003CCC9C40